jgi:hypothetical protein
MVKNVITNFQPLAGKHCITNSIRQIFVFHGYDLSEDMIFGLGAGLGWFYMERKSVPYPLISARIKPLELEENLKKHLNIKITYHKTSSVQKAYQGLKSQLAANNPVFIYVDMAYLKYLGLPQEAHFGGHSVVVFGLDEEKRLAYVSDRDGKDAPLVISDQIVAEDYH